MPDYDYGCPRCGPFTAFRPMAEYAAPQSCPTCGEEAPRVQLRAPALGGSGASRWMANKGGAAGGSRFSASAGHPGGCGCCSGGTVIPRKDWIRKLL